MGTLARGTSSIGTPPKKRLISAARAKSSRSAAVASCARRGSSTPADPLEEAIPQDEHASMLCRVQKHPSSCRLRTTIRVQHRGRVPCSRRLDELVECGVDGAGDVKLVVFAARPQIDHPQASVAANDATCEIGGRDIAVSSLDRRLESRRVCCGPPVHADRGQAQHGRQDDEDGMHSSHARDRSMRERSMRETAAKAASASTVTTATPTPRETPARSVIVTAPSAVLS